MDRFEQVREQIREAVDLVKVVEEYVHLKAHGRYYMGLCPFHNEKTASFAVYTDRQYFHCYGCGKAGDVFAFMMERDGVSFREAMEILGERAGVNMEGAFARGQASGPRVDFHGTLSKVRDWFRHMLQTEGGAEAREYLATRGLTPAIDAFGLGYHPPSGLREFVEQYELPWSVLEAAGLLSRSKKDRYERFAGRLMFPIEDERGRVVGFGGRILDPKSEKAKYLNSPEAPFFNKRKLLFGLRAAKLANDRKLVVMEGYTDVIAAHLAGMTGAVASLGTALTTDHARLLERFATEGVVLLFDGDRAGRTAADRAFRELVHTRLPVRIALLEEGTDPADLVSALPDRPADEVEAGRARLQSIIDGADDALTVWFRLRRREMDLTLDVNVERITEECGRILVGIADSVRREALARRMGQHLGVPEAVFLRAVNKVRQRRQRPQEEVQPAQAVTGGGDAEAIEYDVDPADWERAEAGAVNPAAGQRRPQVTEGPVLEAELDLLACVFSAPELLEKAADLDVTVHQVGEILDLLRQGWSAGSQGKDEIVRYVFMRCAERPELSQLVAKCLDRSDHIKTPHDSFQRLLSDRTAHATKAQAQQIRYQLQQARAQGDQVLVRELTQQYLAHLRSRGASSNSLSDPA